MLRHSIHSPTSACTSSTSSSDDEGGWEVLEILAERTTTSGENEFLVVWKPTWHPGSKIDNDGPAMISFKRSTKISYSHSTSTYMRVILPVEARTRTEQDYTVLQAAAAASAQRKQRRRHPEARQRDAPAADQGADITPIPTGPRKRLSE
jgi:hypothetical protein